MFTSYIFFIRIKYFPKYIFWSKRYYFVVVFIYFWTYSHIFIGIYGVKTPWSSHALVPHTAIILYMFKRSGQLLFHNFTDTTSSYLSLLSLMFEECLYFYWILKIINDTFSFTVTSQAIYYCIYITHDIICKH